MRIPSLRQQIFGDMNKQFSQIRAQMNKETREKCFETLGRKTDKFK